MIQVFTTGVISKVLGCAPETVAIWYDNGIIKGFRISNGTGHRQIPRKSLFNFFKEQNIPLRLLEDFEKGLPNKIFSTGEAARKVGLKQRTIISMCNSGKLKYYRLPNTKHRKITEYDLDALQERMGGGSYKHRTAIVFTPSPLIFSDLKRAFESQSISSIHTENISDTCFKIGTEDPDFCVLDFSLCTQSITELNKTVNLHSRAKLIGLKSDPKTLTKKGLLLATLHYPLEQDVFERTLECLS